MAHRMMVQLFVLALIRFISRAEGTSGYWRTVHCRSGATHAVSCARRGQQKVYIAAVILHRGYGMSRHCGREVTIEASGWQEVSGTRCHAQVKEAVCRMCGNRQTCINPYSIVEYSKCSGEYPVLEVVHSCKQLNDVEQCTSSCAGQPFPSTLCQPPSVIQALDATYGEEDGGWTGIETGNPLFENNCAAGWRDCVASVQNKTPSYYREILEACNNRTDCGSLRAEVPRYNAFPCRAKYNPDQFDYVTIYYKCVIEPSTGAIIPLPSVSALIQEELTVPTSSDGTPSSGPTNLPRAAESGFYNSPGFQYGVPIAAVLSLVAIVVIITVAVIRSKRRRSFQSSSRKVEYAAENIHMDQLCDAGPTATDYSGPDCNVSDCHGPDDNGPDCIGPDCNGPDCNGPDAQNVYCAIEDKLSTPRPTPTGVMYVSGAEYAAVVKPNKKGEDCAAVKNEDNRTVPNASTTFGDDCMIDNQLYESQQEDTSSDPIRSDIEGQVDTQGPTRAGGQSVFGDEYAAGVEPNKARGECAAVKNEDHLNDPNASKEFADDCMIDNQLY